MIANEKNNAEVLANQRKVLIIDDDTDFADSLADILELQGYTQFIANNPFEALSIVEAQCPHVALVDIRLGNSSGIDLIRRIKDKRADTLCIMVTAYAELETAITAIQEGAYDYLRKPIEAHDLLTTLEHCFEKIWLQKEKEAAEQTLKLRNKELEEANLRLRIETQRTAQALEQQRQSESRYRYLFESAPVGLIEVDMSAILALFPKEMSMGGENPSRYLEENPDLFESIGEKAQITDVNTETLNIFGVDHKEQFRSLFTSYISEEINSFLKQSILAFLHGQHSIGGDFAFQTTADQFKFVLVRADIGAKDQSLGRVLISFLDITERKSAEEALEREQEKFKVLVEEAPLGIIIFDDQGRFKYINPKQIEMFGYTMADCATIDDWIESAIPDHEYRSYVKAEGFGDLEQTTESGHSISKTFNITSKDRTVKTILMRLMVLKSGDRVALTEDISQQLRLEEQMAQAQKMEAVGTLAGGVAHDFNNLLQAIQGYSQLLLIDKSPTDLETVKLKEIIKASERASELTKQLLTFSRKVESKLKPTNLNQVISQVNKLLNRTIPKMIRIDLELEEKIDIINADPVQMEQVLMNMAINARDAMPDGGKLVFATSNVFLDETFCEAHLGLKPGPYIELRISDSGHGLDKDTMEHIFEPFFTTKGLGKGTGLGLSMAYGIVRNHLGHIQCESNPGQGTTFKVYLPSIKKTLDQMEEIVEESIPPGGTETILLVDDEQLLRDIGTAILSRFGYNILTCADGESALEMYRERQSEIALIILDLIMPGMGVKRCLDELLAFNPSVNIVISSGYAGENASRETIEPMVKGFIKKPYDINQMLFAIREILDNDRSRG